jgi:hypothetical protein
MNIERRFSILPQAMSRMVGDETVILELESGTYLGLDPVGTRVWALVSEGKTFGEICDLMVDEYEVEREQLQGDIEAFVTDLARHRLVAVKDG